MKWPRSSIILLVGAGSLLGTLVAVATVLRSGCNSYTVITSFLGHIAAGGSIAGLVGRYSCICQRRPKAQPRQEKQALPQAEQQATVALDILKEQKQEQKHLPLNLQQPIPVPTLH